MKDKIFELLGGMPFFMMSGTQIKPNWTRLFELAVIALVTAVTTTYMATSELKMKLNYIELSNQRLETQISKTCDRLEVMQQKISSIDALQQERLFRERNNRERAGR